jgi:hypothetical protein
MHNAYGIKVSGPVHASGKHLSEAPNDPAGFVNAPPESDPWPQPSLEPIRSFAEIDAEADERVQRVMRQPLGSKG